ncbi:hypothetical protein CRD60_05740 [Bifidobacterium aemilianum]|uniref:ABC-2 type transporter transmembrane domain-containing protein n=1 Tax=Bifidobacterium aemilianum TaxID=2493120 RepID=A0A366KA12_9BIFI|nr:ABC transporter permease [Bifidobacterium aemilianum]RBP97501.1 hypothetical protein CRD60_05740 [Bifidobacterium aemilianum]
MSTCKTALRIIWAHKFYFLVYLVGMSAIMVIIGSQGMQSAVQADASSSVGRFQPAQAKIAVINRDRGSEAGRELGQGLERYLQQSSKLVKVDDDPQALQDANVSGKSDLTVIIPAGYGRQCMDKLNENFAQMQAGGHVEALPKVETAASYHSSLGSLAQLQVDAYFDGLRTAAVTGLGQGGQGGQTIQSDQGPEGTQSGQSGEGARAGEAGVGGQSGQTAHSGGAGQMDRTVQSGQVNQGQGKLRQESAPIHAATLRSAVAYTVSHYASNQPAVKVHAIPKGDSKTLAQGFARTVSLAAYPLMTALAVCVATLFGAFSSADRHRRLLASPMPSNRLNGQELLAAFIVAVISWAYYVAITVFNMHAVGVSLASLGWGRVILSFTAMLAFTASAAAFGFMLSQFNPSSSVVNSVGVTFGLLVMFTSGASSSGSLPPIMQTIGKLTPGWWYNSAVGSIMDSSAHGVSVWGGPLVVVILFALAYACIGLMVSRLTRTRSTLASATSLVG